IDFFFQAEDGIRGRTVTGVQTCALPIYRLLSEALQRTGNVALGQFASRGKQYLVVVRPHAGGGGLVLEQLRYAEEVRNMAEVPRSEERRVGKGGGSWGLREQ